ncbi:hypothetical protein [Cloacibacillus porcorum]|uniref:hypothetical protein n=1 Tax=Cloacibacillus porcorum TaxID=1197717 RepID=UPI002671E7B8|nr:hypothetical protein [Cloacibacillus porcorum]
MTAEPTKIIVVDAGVVFAKLAEVEGLLRAALELKPKQTSKNDTNDWLTATRFIAVNNMGRTRMKRLVEEGKIEMRDLGKQYKQYRWK